MCLALSQHRALGLFSQLTLFIQSLGQPVLSTANEKAPFQALFQVLQVEEQTR